MLSAIRSRGEGSWGADDEGGDGGGGDDSGGDGGGESSKTAKKFKARQALLLKPELVTPAEKSGLSFEAEWRALRALRSRQFSFPASLSHATAPTSRPAASCESCLSRRVFAARACADDAGTTTAKRRSKRTSTLSRCCSRRARPDPQRTPPRHLPLLPIGAATALKLAHAVLSPALNISEKPRLP